MDITVEMLQAAVSQAVKEKMVPSHVDTQEYLNNWSSIERIIKAALDASKSS
jgi:hypothetical protein